MKENKTVKRKYRRPSLRVESLQNLDHLLTTSGKGMGKRDSYEATDDNPFGGGNSAGARDHGAWDDWDE